MSEGVSDSQFYMWRTLFSIAHADNVVTDEEIRFMAHVLEDISFSDEQTSILKDDIINAKDVEQMFHGVTHQDDREKFFEFARDLVWVDGDYGSEEQAALIKLMNTQYKETDVDSMVGNVSLELEDDSSFASNANASDEDSQTMTMMSSFRRYFLNLIGGE